MGQLASTEEAALRQAEVDEQLSKIWQRMDELAPAARAERLAGIPPEPGSKQALYNAACRHSLCLLDESSIITERYGEHVLHDCGCCVSLQLAKRVPARR